MSTPRLALACAAIAITCLPFALATAGCDRRARPRHPTPDSPVMHDGPGARAEDGGYPHGDAGPASPEPTFTEQPGDIHI